MADLGIIDAPKVGEGKPITSKRIPKYIIEECIKSVIRFQSSTKDTEQRWQDVPTQPRHIEEIEF